MEIFSFLLLLLNTSSTLADSTLSQTLTHLSETEPLNPTSFSWIAYCCNEVDTLLQIFTHTESLIAFSADHSGHSTLQKNLCPPCPHNPSMKSHDKLFESVSSATLAHAALAEGIGSFVKSPLPCHDFHDNDLPALSHSGVGASSGFHAGTVHPLPLGKGISISQDEFLTLPEGDYWILEFGDECKWDTFKPTEESSPIFAHHSPDCFCHSPDDPKIVVFGGQAKDFYLLFSSLANKLTAILLDHVRIEGVVCPYRSILSSHEQPAPVFGNGVIGDVLGWRLNTVVANSLDRGGEADEPFGLSVAFFCFEVAVADKIAVFLHRSLEKHKEKSLSLLSCLSSISKIYSYSRFGSVFGYFFACGLVAAYILAVFSFSSNLPYHTVENAGSASKMENTALSASVHLFLDSKYDASSVDDRLNLNSRHSCRKLEMVSCHGLNHNRRRPPILKTLIMRVRLIICCLVLSFGLCTSNIGQVTSFAGSISSANGIGTNSRFNRPYGTSMSPDGLYVLVVDSLNHLIRHMIISTSSVTTLAGLALTSGSANGIGTNSRFNSPNGISISPDGSYALVADFSNHFIRHIVISTASVTTLVGLAGTSGSTNGIGTNSRFNNPYGVAISTDGSYALVTDGSNHIRHIIISTASVTTLAGLAGTTGSVNGIGTNSRFSNPRGISISPDGSYALVIEQNNHLIRRIIISTASVTTLAGLAESSGSTNGIGTDSRFNSPRGIFISPTGSYALVADTGSNLIRHIIISTASVTTLAGLALTTGSSDGIGSNSRFNSPSTLTISPDGSYAIVGDTTNDLIRHIIISTTSVTTLGGSTAGAIGSINGIGAISKFNSPRAVSFSPDGSYALVADATNHLIRHLVISTSFVTTFAGLALTGDSTNGIGTNSRFNSPYGISISPDGSYALVADTNNHLIRHIIISTSSVTTLAGLAGTTGSVDGIGTDSRFNSPNGIAISPDGSYALVGDTNNHLIRHIIISSSSVTTLAGLAGTTALPASLNGIGTNSRFASPRGVSISTDGSYALVADSGTRLIRHIIISTASVTTLVGSIYSVGSTNGIGTNSKFNSPYGVAISTDGSYALVADATNRNIRHINISTSSVSALAGAAGAAGSVDGIGTNSRFNNPNGIAISPDGSYALVADTNNHLVRHIVISTLSPTCVPSTSPTYAPSLSPTYDSSTSPPTFAPSLSPTYDSSTSPTYAPSLSPTCVPSTSPTFAPSLSPTYDSSTSPTYAPSLSPTCVPSTSPTFAPSQSPTYDPSTSPPTFAPSLSPTYDSSTSPPTFAPSSSPTSGDLIGESTALPTGQPTGLPSSDPSGTPTYCPSFTPNVSPTLRPSIPFCRPTLDPSTSPTFDPSTSPSFDPSTSPTFDPSVLPTFVPTFQPTDVPTSSPSFKPVFPRVPTLVPTFRMRSRPSKAPTLNPTFVPTASFSPTQKPTTATPTANPSIFPSSDPTGAPTCHPSRSPTSRPSSPPTDIPSPSPTFFPSGLPSAAPTFSPTSHPTRPTPAPIPNMPTPRPTIFPSIFPTRAPTNRPTIRPTRAPTKGAGGGIRLESLTTNTYSSRNHLQGSTSSTSSLFIASETMKSPVSDSGIEVYLQDGMKAHPKTITTSSAGKVPSTHHYTLFKSGSKSAQQPTMLFYSKQPTPQSFKNNVPTKHRID